MKKLVEAIRRRFATRRLWYEMRKLEVREGDIVVLQMKVCNPLLTQRLLSALPRLNNVTVILLDQESRLETLNEADMTRAGWQRITPMVTG